MDTAADTTLDRFIIMNGMHHAGGGIYNPGAGVNLTITNSSIQNNRAASSHGGGIYNNGNLTLTNTTVSNNSADYGGGIDNYPSGNLVLNNSTVSNNSAFYGGGIYNEGSFTINNTTISDNSAYYGGGIYNSIIGGNVLRNSILARNIMTYSSPDCYGTVGSSGHNLIGTNSGCTFTATTGDKVGTSVSPIDPRLTILKSNGGLTLTHALITGSPAIDAGNPAAPGSGGNACLANDQRGVARPVGVRCDIGAYEGSIAWTFVPLVSTYTHNGSDLPGDSSALRQTQIAPQAILMQRQHTNMQ
jgi:hypothetical protein